MRAGSCKKTGATSWSPFKMMVVALEVRLVLVGDEEFGCVEVTIGHERPAAVGGSVVRDEVLADAEVQAVADLFDPPVGGVPPRPPRDSWRWRTSVTSSIS